MLGDLSPDQARYADQLASATGLDPSVVVAWVGAESGWGVYKGDHNYLNIGPGRQYTSTDQAAAAAAQLVTSSPNYGGIRAAIPAGAAAQVAAIGTSPWGTSASVLHTVWQDLSSATGGPLKVTPAGWTDWLRKHIYGGNNPAPFNPKSTDPTDPIKGPGNAVAGDPLNPVGGLGDLLNSGGIVGEAISGVLSLVFIAGALALVGMGLSRLTGVHPKEAFSRAQSVVGHTTQAAAVAGL